MGFQTTLLTAAGEYLDAENVGRWLTTGTYSTDDTAITIDTLTTATNKAIALALYPVTDGPGTDSVVGLQLRIRGAPKNRASAKDISDRAFDALHDLTHTEWAGIPIVRIWRQSGADLGLDGNDRQELTDNYYIQLTRTGTHRTD